MQLSASAITEFKEIYQKHVGEVLTDEEANEKGLDLLRFMKLVYKPIPKSTQSCTSVHKPPGG